MNERADIPFLSYAQNHEDVVLWRALQHITPGRYVDVGAADPVIDSVTCALHERGWRGVHVEPVPAYAAALRDARPEDVVVECGIGAEPGVAVLSVADGTGWSTFDAHAAELVRERDRHTVEMEVPIRTLDDVLDSLGLQGQDIHLLKIDVEGFEAAVVAGANLGRWRPWVLLIEATEPGSTRTTHDTWEPMVLAAGYRFCLFDGLNRFYVHEDHADLQQVLSYPACIFDEPYEKRHQADIRRQLDESRAEVERREQSVRTMRTGFEQMTAQHDSLMTGQIRWRNAAVDARAAAAAALAAAADAQAAAAAAAADTADQRRGRDLAEREFCAVSEQLDRVQAELDAIMATVSWRVTAPLRTVRRRRSRGPVTADPQASATSSSTTSSSTTSSSTTSSSTTSSSTTSSSAAGGRGPAAAPTNHASAPEADALRLRMRQAAALLRVTAEAPVVPDGSSLDRDAFDLFADALEDSDAPVMARAWLAHVVATATYPDEATLRAEGRLLRRMGPRPYIDHLVDLFAGALERRQARAVGLDPIVDGVVADVTHTAQHDLQTGIQRVVRETCSRWLDGDRMVPVWWDYGANALRRLGDAEVERLRNWRDHLPSAHGTELEVRLFDDGPSGIIIPWGSLLLLPELTAEPARTEGYRSLACSDVLRGISMIGYDLIPVTAAETVTEAMSHVFSLYLSMVKRSTRLSAISGAAAEDFRAFNAAVVSQGLTGPTVEAHLLPPSPTPVTDHDLDTVAAEFGVGSIPMVLVVGSHEPRKNHLMVLEAAESLWSAGVWFDLLFIGGSGWRSEPFDEEIARLRSLNRPVQVLKRATETQLWASYRLARFSVFPSLVEGYGLPIVESIASGTPVITTNYGSMAEVAADGGAVLVDPCDPMALAIEMRRLLTDDDELERLRAEAASRHFGSWDDYADRVWAFLVEGV
jgi:FkbM family methyltransferase